MGNSCQEPIPISPKIANTRNTYTIYRRRVWLRYSCSVIPKGKRVIEALPRIQNGITTGSHGEDSPWEE